MKTQTKRSVMLAMALSFMMPLPVLAQAAGAPTANGVAPTSYPGNFVSENDDQVCYDMSRLGYIGEVTSEMRGFKIDPPTNFDNGYVNTTLSTDKKYLDWTSTGAKMLALIVKGGNHYNLYDYVSSDLTGDQLLHSPLNRRGSIPEISHYNVCFEVTPTTEFTGCTRGYWRNHADRWNSLKPSDDFDSTFGVDLFATDITLGNAIKATGGGESQLAAQATAALLNSYGGVPNADGTTVSYKYSTAEVIQMVQDAAAVTDDLSTDIDERLVAINAAKDLLDTANNAGCPLSGTKADPVK